MASVPEGSTSTRGLPSESRRWLKRRLPRQVVRRQKRRKRTPLTQKQELWDRARRLFRTWWVWAGIAALMFVLGERGYGITATIVAWFFHVASPRFHPAEFAIDSPLRTDSPEFLITMAGITASPLIRGNRLVIYNNGDQFYPAMLEAIESARKSITMEQYIFWNDQIGLRFVDAFAERASAGIPVKILLDAVGSSNIGWQILKMLEDAGCDVAWFRPVRWFDLNLANFRTHRKSIVVDGRIAFTGGAGIGDHWLGNAEDPLHWRDINVLIEGQAAMAQQAGFAQNWLLTTGEMITGDTYFSRTEAAGDVAVQTILSSPGSGAGAAGSMYFFALQCAEKSIWIANPYFIPSSAAVNILAGLVKRGVDIKLMLSGECCDSWWARQNSLRLYEKLLKAGVEIYEYEPTMLHQKTMVIDEAWATVGTTNFDNRSFALNEETNVCFYDHDQVLRMKEIFLADLKHCRQIHLDRWSRRSLFQKTQERAASLLQDQV